MSASTSTNDTPSISRDQEASSSPDDGDARGKPGNFAVRFGAQVLDFIFRLALSLGVGFAVGKVLAGMARSGAVAPTWQVKIAALSLGTFGWGIAGTFLYHVLSEAIGGATLGKWICGLRVYSADFSPDGTFLVALRRCTFGGALVRSLVFFIDAAFFGAVAYFSMDSSRWQQRLGDRWGHTVVARAKTTDLPAKSPIFGILVGTLVWSAVIALSLVTKLL